MSAPIRLIIGLGNPGSEYQATRHNAGFWLADYIADDMHGRFNQEKSFFAELAKVRFEGDTVLIAKPTTFMNRSGQSAGALARFFKLLPEQVLVLHDELDLLPGQVKLKQGGGHAGHNGLRDIQAVLGSPNFWRLRLGIGHPRSLNLAQQVSAFVLSPPRQTEAEQLSLVLDRCRIAMPALLAGDMATANRQLRETPNA